MISLQKQTDIKDNKVPVTLDPNLTNTYGIDGVKIVVGNDGKFYRALKPKASINLDLTDNASWIATDLTYNTHAVFDKLGYVKKGIKIATRQGMNILASAAGIYLHVSAGTLYTWNAAKLGWDETTVTAKSKPMFKYIKHDGTPETGTDTDVLELDKIIDTSDNITAIPNNNNVTYQKVYLTKQGDIRILRGTDIYPTLSDAKRYFNLEEIPNIPGHYYIGGILARKDGVITRLEGVISINTTKLGDTEYGSGTAGGIIYKEPVNSTEYLKLISAPENGETRQVLSELPEIVMYTFNTTALSGIAAADNTPGKWNKLSGGTKLPYNMGQLVHCIPDTNRGIYLCDGSTYSDDGLATYLTHNPIQGFTVNGTSVTTPDLRGRAVMSSGALTIPDAAGAIGNDKTATNGLILKGGLSHDAGSGDNSGIKWAQIGDRTPTYGWFNMDANLLTGDAETLPNWVGMPLCIIGSQTFTVDPNLHIGNDCMVMPVGDIATIGGKSSYTISAGTGAYNILLDLPEGKMLDTVVGAKIKDAHTGVVVVQAAAGTNTLIVNSTIKDRVKTTQVGAYFAYANIGGNATDINIPKNVLDLSKCDYIEIIVKNMGDNRRWGAKKYYIYGGSIDIHVEVYSNAYLWGNIDVDNNKITLAEVNRDIMIEWVYGYIVP